MLSQDNRSLSIANIAMQALRLRDRKRKADAISRCPGEDLKFLYLYVRDADNEKLKERLESLAEKSVFVVNYMSQDCGSSLLQTAARLGNPVAVELLLLHGADPHLAGEDGKQAIHYAASHHKMTPTSEKCCVRLLLDYGADCNARDDLMWTPLHYACEASNLMVVRTLLDAEEVDLQARDHHQSTPLHEAARQGRLDVLIALLDADDHSENLTHAKDESGCTPITLACRAGCTEAVKILMSHDRGKHTDGLMSHDRGQHTYCSPTCEIQNESDQHLSALRAAIECGNTEIVSLLMKDKKDDLRATGSWHKLIDSTMCLPKEDEFLLHLAAGTGNVEILDILLGRYKEVDSQNADGETPLHVATRRNRVENVALLLSKCNMEVIDCHERTALLVACHEGRSRVVGLLLECGAKIDATDFQYRNCLMLGVEAGAEDVISEILHHAAGTKLVNNCDKFGNTALHLAAKSDNIGILKILLQHGSKVDTRNRQQETALHVAAKVGRIAAVRVLLSSNNSLVNAQNNDGQTALHLASSAGHATTVRELVHFGANSHDVDRRGRTALHSCILGGWPSCVEELLQVDSTLVRKTTHLCETPLHLACFAGQSDIVRLLLKWKANVTARLRDGRNALDVAIDRGHENCVMALLDHDTWRQALRNVTRISKNAAATTPFRKMIETMPDAAEVALTRCMTTNDAKTDQRSYQITFDYEFLDDIYEVGKWTDSFCENASARRITVAPTTPNADKFNLTRCVGATPGEDDGEAEAQALEIKKAVDVQEKHPLTIMIQAKRKRLLGHPTVTSLLNNKWRSFGRFFYWSNLISYIAYLVAINVYVTTAPPRYAVNIEASLHEFKSGNKCVRFIPEAHEIWGADCQPTSPRRYFIVILILVFSSIQLAIELCFMLHLRIKYFLQLTNYLALALYILSILVFLDLDLLSQETEIRQQWQWECSAFAILLSWLNLIIRLRRSHLLGIYIFMVGNVSFTFLKFSAVLALFLIGFSISFYVLLQNQYQFQTLLIAFMQTFDMMVGEVNYNAIFLGHLKSEAYQDLVHYEASSSVFYIVFLIVVGLLLTNLLVGLAVSDISSVQKQACMKRIVFQVEGLLGLEYFLPHCLRRRWVVRERTVKPNKNLERSAIWRWCFDEESMKPKEMQDILDTPKSDIEEMRKEIKELKQEIHLLTTAISEHIKTKNAD